jgi:hypothetical protein
LCADSTGKAGTAARDVSSDCSADAMRRATSGGGGCSSRLRKKALTCASVPLRDHGALEGQVRRTDPCQMEGENDALDDCDEK